VFCSEKERSSDRDLATSLLMRRSRQRPSGPARAEASAATGLEIRHDAQVRRVRTGVRTSHRNNGRPRWITVGDERRSFTSRAQHPQQAASNFAALRGPLPMKRQRRRRAPAHGSNTNL
jgi:hypothetical protein